MAKMRVLHLVSAIQFGLILSRLLSCPVLSGSKPVFQAIRDEPMKDRSPPKEPRNLKSLLAAVKKSVLWFKLYIHVSSIFLNLRG
ncbi:hypothetical protein Ccrd_018160 [Cynara cardunculus var. scolymus]|uniref:DUF7148 domain-containing protein n=1 Tax=Cynara cardunculus var. scolymus TaxID=59895 RepID=A0A118K1Z0_CYNCS|nr:hypothetical protein Ccrd_018160 [Cynara cardunculus var. scolymus]